jgi:hypothetical protein
MKELNDILAYKIAITLLTEGLLSKNKDIEIQDIPTILSEIAEDYEYTIDYQEYEAEMKEVDEFIDKRLKK